MVILTDKKRKEKNIITFLSDISLAVLYVHTSWLQIYVCQIKFNDQTRILMKARLAFANILGPFGVHLLKFTLDTYRIYSKERRGALILGGFRCRA